MNMRKLGMTAAVAGAMGAAAFGLGAGVAQADPDVWVPVPGIPDFHGVHVPPGHFGVPPGQLKKIPGTPVYGVPPGHWDDAINPVVVVPLLPPLVIGR